MKLTWSAVATGAASILMLAAAELNQPTVASSRAAMFNVKQYGAKGDGATDDQVAIQNTLDAASRIPGSIVYFPPGNYLHSDQLLATSITVTSNRATLTATSAGHQALVFSGFQAGVSGMTFASTVAGSDAVIKMFDVDVFSISHNTVTRGFANGFYIDHSSNGSIVRNTVFTDPNAEAMNIFNDFNILVGQNFIRGSAVDNCVSTVNTNQIEISSNTIQGAKACILSHTCKNVSIVNNDLSYASEGNAVLTQLQDTFVVKGNKIKGPGALPFNENDIVGGNSAIVGLINSNETISDNVMTDVGAGCFLYGADKLAVTNNTVSNCYMGIKLDSGTTSNISGNRVLNALAQGVVVMEGSGYVSVSMNKFGQCGLQPFTNIDNNSHSVLFVNSTASSIRLLNNTYVGNAANLSYFIRCLQTVPIVEASGNKTNSLLPSVFGP